MEDQREAATSWEHPSVQGAYVLGAVSPDHCCGAVSMPPGRAVDSGLAGPASPAPEGRGIPARERTAYEPGRRIRRSGHLDSRPDSRGNLGERQMAGSFRFLAVRVAGSRKLSKKAAS